MNPGTTPAGLRPRIQQALARSDWPQVYALAETLAALDPGDWQVHYLLGQAAMELRRNQRALEHFRQALALRPGDTGCRVQLARTLASLCLWHEALALCDALFREHPDDALVADCVGVIRNECGMHEAAGEAFARATRLAPDDPAFLFNHAVWLGSNGDLDAADRAFEACLGQAPQHWPAHYTLAINRRQTPDHNHVPRLQALLRQYGRDPVAGLYLGCALAKELDDLGRTDEAFNVLVQAKAGFRRILPYDSHHDAAIFAALQERFAGASGAPGCASEEPIFIVGMARSGTTLVDRILSGHPDVHPAGELFNFAIACKQVIGETRFNPFDPDAIRSLPEPDWQALGERYIASTRPATGHTPRFTDKLPQNYLYLGLIAQALPNARFICLRRHPLDTCLANFRHVFAPGSPYFAYTYDLFDVARYWLLFDRLMAHWRQVFPGRILEVHYGDLVQDPARHARAILEFCGLDWHDDCLAFDRNSKPVRSASAPQLREPIHRRGLDHWQAYARQLEPLRGFLAGQGAPV